MHRPIRSLLVALAVAAGAATAAAPAEAATCAHHAHELKRKAAGVLWTSAGSLYVCTAYYRDAPTSKKIGPWTKKSQYSFDGSSVAWTVQVKVDDDFIEDRVYVANGPFGTWLKGVKPATGLAGVLDTNVQKIVVYGDVAGWVTKQGEVYFAVIDPDGEAGAAVGAGTPGAAAPVVPGVTDSPTLSAEDLLDYKQGLFSGLKPTGRRMLVGRWTALDPKALASTLRLKYKDGDGDECGGVSTYELTVRPVAGQPRVGATWATGWSSTSSVCRGL
jgi:hypothetical protein